MTHNPHHDPNNDSHGDPKPDAFAQRLDEALDERRSLDDAQWLEETREDSANRELLEGYRALAEGVRQRRARPQDRPSADLGMRVLSQLRAEAGEKKGVEVAPAAGARPNYVRIAKWAAAIAACLMIAWAIDFARIPWGGGNLAEVKQPKTPPKTLANPGTVQPTPQPAPVVAANDPELRTLVADAGDRYLELAKETRESFAEVAILLPSVSSGETAGAAKKQWIDQVGDGLKPVTRSVGGAFDFLLQSIPVEEPRS